MPQKRKSDEFDYFAKTSAASLNAVTRTRGTEVRKGTRSILYSTGDTVLANAVRLVVAAAVGSAAVVSAAVEACIHPATQRPCHALRIRPCAPLDTPARTAAWVALLTSVRDALCAVKEGSSADANAHVEHVAQAAFEKFAAGFGA